MVTSVRRAVVPTEQNPYLSTKEGWYWCTEAGLRKIKKEAQLRRCSAQSAGPTRLYIHGAVKLTLARQADTALLPCWGGAYAGVITNVIQKYLLRRYLASFLGGYGLRCGPPQL